MCEVSQTTSLEEKEKRRVREVEAEVRRRRKRKRGTANLLGRRRRHRRKVSMFSSGSESGQSVSPEDHRASDRHNMLDTRAFSFTYIKPSQSTFFAFLLLI